MSMALPIDKISDLLYASDISLDVKQPISGVLINGSNISVLNWIVRSVLAYAKTGIRSVGEPCSSRTLGNGSTDLQGRKPLIAGQCDCVTVLVTGSEAGTYQPRAGPGKVLVFLIKYNKYNKIRL
jgi:hypothetical protein